MKKILLLGVFVTSLLVQTIAQVSVTTDASAPDPSAMLDVKSNTKGALMPRMSQSQISLITNPVDGLIVFCTSDHKFYTYTVNTNTWKELSFGTGSIVPWSCGLPISDSRDGKIYNTVLIGTQCWTKENMNIGSMITATNDGQNNHNAIEKYCYTNTESNCDIYGGLYQWNNMMQWSLSPGAQGICPAGWHIPADGEWTSLVTFLGGETIAGGKMKETGTTHWGPPNTGATNSSGFTALPGGLSHINTFGSLGVYGLFWSSSQYLSFSYAYSREIWCAGEFIHKQTYEWGDSYSVRCIKD